MCVISCDIPFMICSEFFSFNVRKEYNINYIVVHMPNYKNNVKRVFFAAHGASRASCLYGVKKAKIRKKRYVCGVCQYTFRLAFSPALNFAGNWGILRKMR